MVAASEMDVDGLVEFDFGFEIFRKDDGLTFGVGSSEFTTGVSGAGDEPTGDGGGGVSEASGFDGNLGVCQFFVRDVRDEEVLPSGKTNVSGAKLFGDAGDGMGGFASHTPDGDHDTDIVISVGLLIGAVVTVLEFWPGFFAKVFGDEAEGEGQFLLNFVEELGRAPVIDQILQAGFFAIRAVAMFDEDAEHRGGHSSGLAGCD